MNYYNEFAKKPAAGLRQLIEEGLIPKGEVDERDIKDVHPSDLIGFNQCHFFAGIGGWPLALSIAGWPADRPVWTGSAPCQPFSGAGKGKGGGDDRHAWPAWFSLIKERQPAKIFGEQVASAVPHGWIDRVFTDLESCDYSCAAAILPACSADAPHLRNRLWFVGDSEYDGLAGSSIRGSDAQAHVDSAHRTQGAGQSPRAGHSGDVSQRIVADSFHTRWEGGLHRGEDQGWQAEHGHAGCGGAMLSHWGESRWIVCGDGKIRRIPTIESGIQLLAHGFPQKVGLLAAGGNAIVPEVAARFIKANM